MKSLSFFSVTLCLCGQLFAAPTTVPSASSQPSDPVELLISQLSADEWRQREDAQEQLVAIGPNVLARLQRVVAESADEEARQRADSAIARIRERQLIGPSSITLHVKNVSLRDVFAEISKQCGVQLKPFPPELWEQRPWPKVSFDFDDQPFWFVMRTIAEQTGVELKAWNNDGLHLIQSAPAAASAGRWTVTGPFLITLYRASRNQSIDFGPNENVNSDFVLTFSGVAEPKLRVIRASYLAKLDEATDDRGNSLLSSDEGDELTRRGGLDLAYTGNQTGQWQFTARLANVKNMGTRLTVLRGSSLVQLQTRADTLEVPNILSASNVTRSVAGMNLTVNSAKKVADRYEVNVTISRAAANAANPGGADEALDWQRIQQCLTDIRLLDDQGRAFERSTFSSGGTEQTAEVSMSFVVPMPGVGAHDMRGEPSKLVWLVPTEVKDVLIPFEFKDVPLPQ